MEGFGDIVIGARLQHRHLFLPALPGGEHQNGQGDLLAAPAADHAHAVFSRQAEVDDRDIRALFADKKSASLAFSAASTWWPSSRICTDR